MSIPAAALAAALPSHYALPSAWKDGGETGTGSGARSLHGDMNEKQGREVSEPKQPSPKPTRHNGFHSQQTGSGGGPPWTNQMTDKQRLAGLSAGAGSGQQQGVSAIANHHFSHLGT